MQIYLIFIQHFISAPLQIPGKHPGLTGIISMFSLKNKTAIITGGGSGIGRAICLLFAQAGARIYLIDIDEKGSAETVGKVREAGGIAEYYICAVDQETSVQHIVQKIIEAQVPDILVNNAGIAHIGNVETTNPADFEKLFSVNVKGVYHLVKTCIPHMKARGGVILNMASIAAIVGLPDRFAYSMTKGAVAAMTLSIAKDYIKYNIRCNSISPARVHTPFVDGFIAKNYTGMEEEMFKKLSASQPIGRMAKPEEVAALALYLCSDEASFITGNDYPIDGGFVKLKD
jgi:2-keto-3-deoxy-L-fuconate dehydrogenase